MNLYKVYSIILIFLLQCNSSSSKEKKYISQLLGDPSIQVYFSYPGRMEEPEKKEQVTQVVLGIIRNTHSTLEIHAYSLNHPEVLKEIVSAYKRGVSIKLVGDAETDYSPLVQEGIPVYLWKTTGLHHIKAILSDNKTFFTGTGNFSRYGLSRDWNGYFKIELQNPLNSFSDFLNQKYTKPFLEYRGIYFINSPDYGNLIQSNILRNIESSNTKIQYLIFDHYDPVITHSLKKASNRGIAIQGVYDSPVDDEGEYLYKTTGWNTEVLEDGNYDQVYENGRSSGGLLHHKTMILDDKTLITGSYNYSLNARDKNRELMIQTNNQYIVSEFKKEFLRVYSQSKKISAKKDWNQEVEVSGDISKTEFCIQGEGTQPILEFGEGIFKSYLYYPKLGNCFGYKKYSEISSGLANYKEEFIFNESNFNGAKIYDRLSSKKWTTTKSDSIFYQSKKFNPVYLSNFNVDNSGKVSFLIRGYDRLFFKKLYLWTGSKLYEGNVEFSESYASNLVPQYSVAKSGIVFLEQIDNIGFYCFTEKGSELPKSIQYFIDTYNYQKALDDPQIELIQCNEM